MGKTVQALRVAARWSPTGDTAVAMAMVAFGGAKFAGLAITGGTLYLKHAILVDFSDPAYTAKVSERVAGIKTGLAEIGELHDFTATACAVPAGSAEDLHEPAPEPELEHQLPPAPPEDESNAEQVAAALTAGWLPDGWRRDTTSSIDGNFSVIVPDEAAPKGKLRGSTALIAMMHNIKTESGKVLKTAAA